MRRVANSPLEEINLVGGNPYQLSAARSVFKNTSEGVLY